MVLIRAADLDQSYLTYHGADSPGGLQAGKPGVRVACGLQIARPSLEHFNHQQTERSMKKVTLLASLAVLMTSAVAFAGWKYTDPVQVYEGGAFGVIGDARASSDSYQYIACYVYRSPTYSYAYCSARNSALVNSACTTQDPAMISAAESAGSGYIRYGTGSGGCTFIAVETSSRNRPVTP